MSITSAGTLKIHKVSEVKYNTSRKDIINQTTAIKINYTPPSICGNGIKEGAEQCDDGNITNGDGCDNLCKSETLVPCTDSDNGKDYYTKGLTKGLYFGNSQYTENYDYCVMNN